MSVILSIKDLEVRYGGILALKGMSFEVQKGEIVSLIGANGAGKTTTLRAISGLINYSGKISFVSSATTTVDLASIPKHEIVRLGIAHSPEGRGIFPNLTVLENLSLGAFARTNRDEVAKDLDHCYELFPRLKEQIRQKAGTLSGGEQQMVAISRALMSKPSLLLLDEPSLGLAPIIVSQIFEIIKKLN